MNPAAKLLIAAGVALILAGVLWQFGGRFISGLPFGKLPGDISIDRPGFRFYFPLATSILLSVILSTIVYLFRKP